MLNPSNMCCFEGRIITDPQFQTMSGQSGQFLKATFTVAADRNNITAQQRQAARNGDNSIVTSDFFRCSAIGASAEFVQKWCPKGKAVKVVARYTTYKYNDKNTGQEQYGNQFDVDAISFVTQDSKNLQQNQPNNGGGYQQQNNGYQQQPQGGYQAQPQQGGYQVQGQPQQGGYQQPAPNFMNPPQPALNQQQSNFEMFDDSNSPF